LKSNYIIAGIIISVFFAGMALSYVVFGQVSITPYSDLRQLEIDGILQNKDFQKELISKIMNHDEIRNKIIQEFYQSERYLKELKDGINFEN